MPDTPMIRILRFRPIWVGLDVVVRDRLVPRMRTSPGLLDVMAGRQGPEELGGRIVVSVWSTAEALAAAHDGEDPAVTGRLDGAEEIEVETYPLRIDFRSGSTESPRIVRVFRGQIRPGERDAYVEDARTGTLRDAAAGTGPLSLYLATGTGEPDTVLTVSTWLDWGAIEAATGGDIRKPVATRHPERLLGWEAVHYEAILA